MRILAVDPGEKNIGLAVSDPTGTIANPLGVLHHLSREIDAATIAQYAVENQVSQIVIGQSLDSDGQPTFQSRRASRLAVAVRNQTDIPVVLWEESHSTKMAQTARILIGASRKKRCGHLDDLAATVILQSFMDNL
jgi:putative Holliday junction resolvase